ncbi:mannose-6-phosphate isomerase, class I [Demequina sp.]|uniref:mannose-6-phosphate isomerase, class I n=1 Tax=Demequina sp. TaxID=2050685 RepID=UPI003D0D47CE
MIRIDPRLKAFSWGQHGSMARILALEDLAGPVAEAWFGAHETDPSALPDGSDLAAFIAADPERTVGGERLPYLLKILAIASPLSIQVHPTLDQAHVGFEAEEERGVAIDAPDRTFRDPRHKPELIVALTPMRLLVGLRDVRELAADLRKLGADDLVALVDGRESLLTYVMAVLGGEAKTEVLDRLAHQPEGDSALALAGRAARAFPGDPGALVALAMNPVVLQPGEGCYVPPRVIHSYQSGIGVEIMANSDNVVRGGLTPKMIDVARLEAILDAQPAAPLRPVVARVGCATTYAVPVEDFALVRLERGAAHLPAVPRIVLALDPTTVTTASDSIQLDGGTAAFVPLSDGVAEVRTDGAAFVALPGGGAMLVER